LVAAFEQPVGEVRPEEAGATRDKDSTLEMHTSYQLQDRIRARRG
jgi:hypothetical protein